MCLSACGDQYDQPGNEAIREAFERYPDVIVGMGYIRLGIDGPDLVDRLRDQGFGGAKVINPRKNYNDKDYYPIYERLARWGMPILFHTGVVARLPKDGQFDTASDRMRPIFLDGIARAFPELTLIGAHLGVPWFDEACCVAAVNPNVYFDLSGVAGRFVDRPAGFFEAWIYLDRAKPKLMFGVDGNYEKIPEAIEANRKLLKAWDFSDDMLGQALYGNMARILGMEEGA